MKLLFAVNSVGAFGDGLYAYLLPVFLTENLGASPEEVGILYAAMSLCAALTLLVAGILADKYDRKKIMIVGWLAWVPAPLIFSLARNWLDALPGMMLWGVWLGGPTVTAYVVATADKNRLTLTFTTISAAWSLGTFSRQLLLFSVVLSPYLCAQPTCSNLCPEAFSSSLIILQTYQNKSPAETVRILRCNNVRNDDVSTFYSPVSGKSIWI